MKKRATFIKIKGFRGLFLSIFIIACLVTGFLVFPAWCCMHIWNAIASMIVDMPIMHLEHGLLLWLIIALSIYAGFFNSKILFVSSKKLVDFIPQKSNISSIDKDIKCNISSIKNKINDNVKVDENEQNLVHTNENGENNE